MNNRKTRYANNFPFISIENRIFAVANTHTIFVYLSPFFGHFLCVSSLGFCLALKFSTKLIVCHAIQICNGQFCLFIDFFCSNKTAFSLEKKGLRCENVEKKQIKNLQNELNVSTV